VNLAISEWSFIWAIIIGGFGSGCIFVPLSTTTMAGIPNEEIGNASGLNNLMRNLWGSIGISVLNTIVARHQQLHRNEMSRAFSGANPTLQAQLQGMKEFLMAQGASATTALHQAYGLLNGELTQQARLWAYVDDFRYIALGCFACFPVVFLLKKAVGRGGVSAGHGVPQVSVRYARERSS